MTDDEFEKFRQSTNDDFDAIALGNGLHRVSKCTRDYQPINYGNHSCSPNAKLNDLGLVTIRDIEPGEEITSDYANFSSADWSMACTCGAPNCRGIVVGRIR